MFNKTLLATALGFTTLVAVPAFAATWAGAPGTISVSGTITTAAALPGKWQWASGSKTDFAGDAKDMTDGVKKLTITIATDPLPILVGRMTSPMLSGGGITPSVKFVQASGTTAPTLTVESGRALGMKLTAPIVVGTAEKGIATFNAKGAGMRYTAPSNLATAYIPRALNPAAGTTDLCSGLVGHTGTDDNAAAVTAATTWLTALDSTLTPAEADMTRLFLEAGKVLNASLTTGPAAGTAAGKFSGQLTGGGSLELAQCGLAVAVGDTINLAFTDGLSSETTWAVKLTPQVTYN